MLGTASHRHAKALSRADTVIFYLLHYTRAEAILLLYAAAGVTVTLTRSDVLLSDQQTSRYQLHFARSLQASEAILQSPAAADVAAALAQLDALLPSLAAAAPLFQLRAHALLRLGR